MGMALIERLYACYSCPEKFCPTFKPQRFWKHLRFGLELIWMIIQDLPWYQNYRVLSILQNSYLYILLI